MKALDRKVWLPSRGSPLIDRTEAMTVIDVNMADSSVRAAATSRRSRAEASRLPKRSCDSFGCKHRRHRRHRLH